MDSRKEKTMEASRKMTTEELIYHTAKNIVTSRRLNLRCAEFSQSVVDEIEKELKEQGKGTVADNTDYVLQRIKAGFFAQCGTMNLKEEEAKIRWGELKDRMSLTLTGIGDTSETVENIWYGAEEDWVSHDEAPSNIQK